MRRQLTRAGLAILALCLVGCGFVTSTNKSVFVLVDASGTYAKNADSAILSTRVMTSKLQTNDWVGFAQISSCSFSDDGLVVRERLPTIPSQSAKAKTRIFEKLNAYGESLQPTAFTDIKGALRYATNELSQTGDGARYIVIFSDMIEDVSPDCQTQNLDVDLEGVTVIASNITKSKSDERNPQAYFDRLDMWEEFVEASGGNWIVTASGDQIADIIQ